MAEPLAINGQYFSGAQASAFIGDVWVDDILALDYNVQHTRLPQFGYGSQHYDFIPKGNIIVTGSFTVNFREPNYLWLILERYKKFNTTREARLIKASEDDAKEASLTYLTDKRQRFDKFFNSVDAKSAQGSLVEQSREFNGITEDNTKENFNHKTFDITVGYGYDLGADSPSETISGIQIMGKGKVINADGRPIQEQYNFIARKLI